jgi:hypothetical protein
VVGAVVRGRTVALAGVTVGALAGLVPLSALGGLAVLAGLIGALEVRQVRHPGPPPVA